MDPVTKDGYELVFEDRFTGHELDGTHWLSYHLPHWSNREQAAARYAVGDGELRLRIEAEQPPWCPELDGDTRVSSLQTAVFAGPVGSTVGQHRFHPSAVVREAQQEQRLYTPTYGVVELRARATADPRSMVAFWMIGVEDEPERSAEICVCEIFGREVTEDSGLVGMGVHPFGDPRVVDEFEKVEIRADLRLPHVYTMEWTPEQVSFFIDGERVKVVHQSPSYPMQLMLGIYEFGGQRAEDAYPKEFVVDDVRGYRPAAR